MLSLLLLLCRRFVWCLLFEVSWLTVVVGWLLMVVVVRCLLCGVVCCMQFLVVDFDCVLWFVLCLR